MATRKKRGASKKSDASSSKASGGTRGSSAQKLEMPAGDMHSSPPGGLSEMPTGGNEMRSPHDRQTGAMRAMRGGSMDMGQAAGHGLMPGEKGASESGTGTSQMPGGDMSATPGAVSSEMPTGTMGQSNS